MSETETVDYSDAVPVEALPFGQNFDEIRPGDINYLCDYVYPYVQIASPAHSLSNVKPNIIEAKNGWKIIDYGDVLNVSALHGKESYAGSGTIVKQQFDVAFEIVELAKQRHWGSGGDGGTDGEGQLRPTVVQILGGTPMMKRFSWFAAETLGIKLEGFKPTPEEHKWLDSLFHRHVVAEGKQLKIEK